MLTILLAAGLCAVPSPASAILQDMSLVPTNVWVAEADLSEDDKEEVDNLERDMDRAHERSNGKRVRLMPAQTLLVEGHGKGHYLAWGIVDWGIAGGSWMGSIFGAIGSVVLYNVADDVPTMPANDPLLRGFNSRKQARQTYRAVGLGYAVFSGAAALFGGFMAYKAAKNISIYNDMKQQEASLPRTKIVAPPPAPTGSVGEFTL